MNAGLWSTPLDLQGLDEQPRALWLPAHPAETLQLFILMSQPLQLADGLFSSLCIPLSGKESLLWEGRMLGVCSVLVEGCKAEDFVIEVQSPTGKDGCVQAVLGKGRWQRCRRGLGLRDEWEWWEVVNEDAPSEGCEDENGGDLKVRQTWSKGKGVFWLYFQKGWIHLWWMVRQKLTSLSYRGWYSAWVLAQREVWSLWWLVAEDNVRLL